MTKNACIALICVLFSIEFIAQPTAAIHCFHCTGNVTSCEKMRATVYCGELPFCLIKMDQDADTVVQSCASASECRPSSSAGASSSNTTTDAGYSILTGEESENGTTTVTSTTTGHGSTTHANRIMIDCCQQDSCNCAGGQCFMEMSGVAIQPSILVTMVLLFATLFAKRLFM